MTDPILPDFKYANADFVTHILVIGGDLSPDDLEATRQCKELVEFGVTHIVDVRIEASDKDFVRDLAPDIEYLHLGLDDAGQRVPYEWFESGFKFVAQALEDPRAVVLTHCHMGINRGPSLGFAVLLGLGWSPSKAMDAIRAARPIAHVDYAEDALDWYHSRFMISPSRAATDRRSLATWRQANQLDVQQIIRGIRSGERR